MPRKHPLTFTSLMVAVLLPMVTGITLAGMALQQLAPVPNLLQILAGGCAFVLLVPVLMCIGAYSWLVLARRIVPRRVAQAFFVFPGVGVFSKVSEWMFLRVYGE